MTATSSANGTERNDDRRIREPWVEERLDWSELEEWSEASALLVECRDLALDRCRFIGPFPKDGADALTLIKRLYREQDPDRNALLPIEYSIRLLFDP